MGASCVARVLTVVAAAGVLSGCGINQPGPHDFDELVTIRVEIAPETCGSIVYDDRSGALHRLDGASPVLAIVVEDPEAYDCLVVHISQSYGGNDEGGALVDNDQVSASTALRRLAPGDTWQDLDGISHKAAKASAYLVIQGRPATKE